MYERVPRCDWCGGVFALEHLCLEDADGEPNEPCVCGEFEEDPRREEGSPKKRCSGRPVPK